MKPRLLLRPAAEVEIEEAFLWYEARRAGLGEELRRDLRQSLERIEENPKLYAKVHRRLRRCLLDRFPYALFFTTTATESVIVAFFHTSRDPRTWQRR